MVRVSGIGSWPGTDVRAALQAVLGDLAELSAEGASGMPYLPELPARGPGSDMIGRTAHLLRDMPVDLQPQGWRLVDRPGLDASRTAALWREDLDELAEIFDGYEGDFKVQVVGPWTLASQVWLPFGDRVLSDQGAMRDLFASLAAGLTEHLRHIARVLPRARLIVQIDEPSLPTILAGRVPSASGYRRLPAPAADDAASVMQAVIGAATAQDVETVLHCCARRPPLRVMREAAPGGISIDTTGLDIRRWEGIAVAVESGIRLWAGALATDVNPAGYRPSHEELVRRWREVGLPMADLAHLSITPACGMAGLSPQDARDLSGATVRLGRDLAESAAE
ncbi:MAG: methionine synthase [Ornithinimicrobium sp.]